jgi:hypothetical protein
LSSKTRPVGSSRPAVSAMVANCTPAQAGEPVSPTHRGRPLPVRQDVRGVDADPEFLGKLCIPAGISRPHTPAKSTTGSRARATAWMP